MLSEAFIFHVCISLPDDCFLSCRKTNVSEYLVAPARFLYKMAVSSDLSRGVPSLELVMNETIDNFDNTSGNSNAAPKMTLFLLQNYKQTT